MLYDSLSEEDGQPPPYTDQPKASSKSSKVKVMLENLSVAVTYTYIRSTACPD